MSKTYLEIQSTPFRGAREVLVGNRTYYVKSKGYSDVEIAKFVKITDRNTRDLRKKLDGKLEIKTMLRSS